MSAHEHEWRLHLHLDGCHFYSSTYLCACGATRYSRAERDVAHDPYAMVWLLETCDRCAELAGGAKPLYSDEIELPKGTTT